MRRIIIFLLLPTVIALSTETKANRFLRALRTLKPLLIKHRQIGAISLPPKERDRAIYLYTARNKHLNKGLSTKDISKIDALLAEMNKATPEIELIEDPLEKEALELLMKQYLLIFK